MKVTYQWLQDFVEIKVSAQELAQKLTMAGLEVVGFEVHDRDAMYEIEITSNRPDWLSVIGVAREVAAITTGKLKIPAARAVMPGKAATRGKGTRIHIEDRKDCPLYIASVIRGVSIKPSPAWLKERLERIGCRSINNVVDITNYCMFEMGEPLHAFDLKKLSGNEIVVRRAGANENITTIDGHARKLSKEFLVIADGNKPVALAGVMGSKDAEVDDSTSDVLLEAAVFSPLLIRKARQTFGLQTDSSYRFERGVPMEVAWNAAARARAMILELAGGVLESVSYEGSRATPGRTVSLECEKVSGFLGVRIGENRIKQALAPLGFAMRRSKKGSFSVQVPCYRQDVKAPIDLIEEVARVYGFENIPSTLASIPPRPQAPTLRDFVVFAKQVLQGLGVSEAVTLSLIDRGLVQRAGLSCERVVPVANPLSQEQEILRPSLIPSLLESVRGNFNHQESHVALFEVAHTFEADNRGIPVETVTLAVLLSGTRVMMLPQGQVKDPFGLLHLKGIVLSLLQRAKVENVSLVEAGNDIEIRASGQVLGTMGSIPKAVLDNFDIKNKDAVSVCLDLEKVYASRAPLRKFVHPPQFPGIVRDISFFVKEGVRVDAIIGAIRELKVGLLHEVTLCDYYKGAQVPAGNKGLVISCEYRSLERTLTEQEVQPLHSSVCQMLQGAFGATLR